MRLQDFFETIGISDYKASYNEILISALGGFLGILAIFIISQLLFDHETTVLIVPSMGASAVLLFAAPHAPFSQSRAAGRLHRRIPELTVAASVGVGMAIGAMYFARCLHPPGGATALAAVVGSGQLHEGR